MTQARKISTLVVVHEHPRVLLGMKKRGFGVGRWNGFGGKLNEGESVLEAAVRELKEEAGISVGRLEKRGRIDFSFEGKPEILEVHIFAGFDPAGEPQESDEMQPKWFFIDEIPFREMWPDDIYWMPLFLKGAKFSGRFLFGPGDSILEKELDVVASLD